LALQTEVWKNEFMAVVMDTRFSKSFTAKDDEKADHYAVMLAVQYTLQEKNDGDNFKK
jgi:hypothetical protein